MAAPILVTGANGHLGRRLVERLRGEREVVAVVRSERAARTLEDIATDIRILDYTDARALSDAAAGCGAAVHLAGIIRETAGNRFEDAHEATARALTQVSGLARIVCLSVVGAARDSANACLASKAAAEDILLSGPTPAVVLRVAMVLGEGDYASYALRRRASSRLSFTFRSASLEQPIDAVDVTEAIVRALDRPVAPAAMDLAGPESLPRRALVRRAARTLGKQGAVVSLPIGLGRVLAGAFEKLVANPPLTRAMLGVLDHDDDVDVAPACTQLGLELTPLDETLARCFGAGEGTP